MKNGLDRSVMPEIPLPRRSFHSKSEMKLKDISRGRSPGRPAHFGTWRRRWDKPPVRVRVDQILLASSLAICPRVKVKSGVIELCRWLVGEWTRATPWCILIAFESLLFLVLVKFLSSLAHAYSWLRFPQILILPFSLQIFRGCSLRVKNILLLGFSWQSPLLANLSSESCFNKSFESSPQVKFSHKEERNKIES